MVKTPTERRLSFRIPLERAIASKVLAPRENGPLAARFRMPNAECRIPIPIPCSLLFASLPPP
jgi:hypothetical protein